MLKIRNLKFRYAESPFSLEIPHLDVAEGQHTAITGAVSYTHLRAHETREDLVCRLLLEKKK